MARRIIFKLSLNFCISLLSPYLSLFLLSQHATFSAKIISWSFRDNIRSNYARVVNRACSITQFPEYLEKQSNFFLQLQSVFECTNCTLSQIYSTFKITFYIIFHRIVNPWYEKYKFQTFFASHNYERTKESSLRNFFLIQTFSLLVIANKRISMPTFSFN